jgi:AraC family transcriptional regulator, arabinose operon regulatory protein
MERFDPVAPSFAPAVHAGSGSHASPVVYRLAPGGLGLLSNALIYTRAGAAFFRTGGREFISRAHDLVLLRPATPVEYGPCPPRARWATLWAHFDPRPGWLPWLNWPEAVPGLAGVFRLQLEDPALRARIVRAFAALCRLARRPHPFHEEFTLHGLAGVLLLCRLANPRENRPVVDGRVQRVAEHLSDHFARTVTLAELAQVARLSASHLEELFKEQIGLTPFAFLESCRMRHALHLLERTSKPVSEIAREVGFEDPLYFSKRFHLRMGRSPRQMRQTMRQAQRPGSGPSPRSRGRAEAG